MRLLSWLVVSLVFLAACGGGSTKSRSGDDAGVDASVDGGDAAVMVDPEYVPGSRIKPQFLVPADGRREFDTFYDSKLDVECWPFSAADGELRCLPVDQEGGTALFTDDGCTQAVLQHVPSCYREGIEKYALDWTVPGCATGASVYKVGAKRDAAPSELYERDLDGTCKAASAPPNDAEFYDLGTALPATDFVAVEKTHGSGTGLSGVYADGADGLHVRIGNWNNDFERDCMEQLDANGDYRCVPVFGGDFAQVLPFTFSNDTCTEPGARQFATECGDMAAPVALEFVLPENGCYWEQSFKAWAIGGAVEPGYDGEPGMCHPQTLEDSGFHWYSLGDELPPASFPAMTREQPTEPRLVVARYGGEGLAPHAYSKEWYDNERGAYCFFFPAADGKWRCIPTTTSQALFQNDTCTEEVAIVNPDCNRDPAHVTIFSLDSNACVASSHTYNVGVLVTPAQLYELDGTDCVESDVSGDIHLLGTEIPASEFVERTYETD